MLPPTSSPIPRSAPRAPTRRALFCAAAASLLPAARAAEPVPLADMHSHFGMISRFLPSAPLGEQMRRHRVALVAWKLVADGRWIRGSSAGIEQSREPAPGELRAFFDQSLGRMREKAAADGLRIVLGAADVDACVAGEPGVVLASEGADFLEGRIDGLSSAYERGLRHLQLVHYIATPVGDAQTREPRHQGLSAFGRELVVACQQRGLLVDLAHCGSEAVEQALALAKAPFVWSHGWVAETPGSWADSPGWRARRLSVAQARRIGEAGGVVGLWGLGLQRPDPPGSLGRDGWTVGGGDRHAYARELAALVERIGADHVAIGSDIEGVGRFWSVNDYGHLREVVELLEAMKLPAATIEKLAWRNYARVLKAALKA